LLCLRPDHCNRRALNNYFATVCFNLKPTVSRRHEPINRTPISERHVQRFVGCDVINILKRKDYVADHVTFEYDRLAIRFYNRAGESIAVFQDDLISNSLITDRKEDQQ
jgi:hypothetical protein